MFRYEFFDKANWIACLYLEISKYAIQLATLNIFCHE